MAGAGFPGKHRPRADHEKRPAKGAERSLFVIVSASRGRGADQGGESLGSMVR